MSAAMFAAQPPGTDDPMQAFRAPLLREGSSLVEAHAVLQKQGEPAWWVLRIESQEASATTSDLSLANPFTSGASSSPTPSNELTVLPCTRLSEMERIIETTAANGAGEAHFKVSGRVYVFRDKNYFLPTHAAVVMADASMSRDSVETPPDSPDATSIPVSPESGDANTASPPLPNDDDSVEAIARALQQQAGPIARSSGAATSTGTPSAFPRSDSAITGAGIDQQSFLQENTTVVNRRGKITRDRSGGWLLVFDSDASGLADPPMKLMPCMLLEAIEEYARRAGNNSPIIVTGHVYLYGNQNHLLPTVFRIPRETSRLTP